MEEEGKGQREGGGEEGGRGETEGEQEERRGEEGGKLTWKTQYSPGHELPAAAHVSPPGVYRAGVWLPLL